MAAAAAHVQWIIPSSDQPKSTLLIPSSSLSKSFHNPSNAKRSSSVVMKEFPNRISGSNLDDDHQDLGKKKKKKKKSKSARLVKISPSDGRWHGNWSCDYIFSMQELHLLHHLPTDVPRDTNVYITLCIQKHAGLGLSVEGKVTTCFTRKCCNCCTPYQREINATFKVWILPSTRPVRDYSSHHELLDIDGDDPSVIFVKPGYEADLDSLIQDTVRLAISVEETCSELCDKSEPKLHYLGARNVASVERRWHKLLELKKKHDHTNS